jgi:hypothetical protein
MSSDPGPTTALDLLDFITSGHERREATSRVVRMNRTNPPDAILREVYERTGDRPFDRIEDVITADELEAVLGRYRSVAGYSKEALGSV